MAARLPHHRRIKRRQFLGGLVGVVYPLLLAACRPSPRSGPPVTLTPPPTRTPTLTPFQPDSPTSALTPSVIASPSPTPLPDPVGSSPLAVSSARITAYDQAQIRQALERMLDALGGWRNLVRPGAKVGLKANLTGGPWSDAPGKPKAVETYVTHPAVVGALCELLRDAGASRLTIMDGLGDETSFEKWGFADVARPVSADLLNLCKPDPYADYRRFAVGAGRLEYDFFWMNPLLADLDVFISVAKMKCHSTAGVTLSLKNLIGLTPIEKYRNQPLDTNRTALHTAAMYAFDDRLPGVIVDINRARPAHFAVIDGISACEGGAGPWEQTLSQVHPGLLLAGFNPLAVDAVATAIMGFDPEAPTGSQPFLHGENHLALASQAGLGSHRLSGIQVIGPSIQELKYPFKSAP